MFKLNAFRHFVFAILLAVCPAFAQGATPFTKVTCGDHYTPPYNCSSIELKLEDRSPFRKPGLVGLYYHAQLSKECLVREAEGDRYQRFDFTCEVLVPQEGGQFVRDRESGFSCVMKSPVSNPKVKLTGFYLEVMSDGVRETKLAYKMAETSTDPYFKEGGLFGMGANARAYYSGCSIVLPSAPVVNAVEQPEAAR